MDLRDLVWALLRHDTLAARLWVADARRTRTQWSEVARPDLGPLELAVAAGLAEMLAARAGQAPPTWTTFVPAAPEPVYLLRADAVCRARAGCARRTLPSPCVAGGSSPRPSS